METAFALEVEEEAPQEQGGESIKHGASVVVFMPAFLSRVLLPRGIFLDTFVGTFASLSPGFFENPLEVTSLLPQALQG